MLSVFFLFILLRCLLLHQEIKVMFHGSKTSLTLKTPRKPASENVVCLCRLLNILANFSNLFFHIGNSVEQSDLGPHCLQQ